MPLSPNSSHKKKHKKKKKVLPIHPLDAYALENFFISTGGEETWINHENWLDFTKPLEKWNGVIVDKETGRVIELWLRYNGLTSLHGIPDSLGMLLCLQKVDLEGNDGLGIKTSNDNDNNHISLEIDNIDIEDEEAMKDKVEIEQDISIKEDKCNVLPASLGNLLYTLELFWISDCGFETIYPHVETLKCGNKAQIFNLFKSIGGDIVAKVIYVYIQVY